MEHTQNEGKSGRPSPSSFVADAIAFCDETLQLLKFQNSSATVNLKKLLIDFLIFKQYLGIIWQKGV